MKARTLKILTALLAFALVFFALQRLVMPKHASPPPGGADLAGGLTREYYASRFDHDVLFIGCCQVWSNFSTVALWQEFGITSFIRGNAQQLIWQSYYLLEEALRRETPQVVVLSVLSMQYNEPQHEAINRLTLDGMRWSRSRLNAIAASRTPDEDWLSWVFPFFRYKDRWRALTMDDVQFFFRNPRVSINGFVINSGTLPAQWTMDTVQLTHMRPPSYTFGPKAMDYLQRITQLTAEAGVPLVLVKAPTLLPYWPAPWDNQIAYFAANNDLLYINLLDYVEDMGLDFSLHTFNRGYHLNVWGAEVVSRFFGDILVREFDLPSRHHEPQTAAYWNALADLHDRIVARQLQEIAATGAIQNRRHE